MSRPRLSLARSPRKPSLSLVKKALRLFKQEGVAKKTYREYAKRWLAMNAWLGDKHLLRGGEPKWGRPGDPVVKQIRAPRRLGERA